jgi:hypothetical protein
MLLAERDRFSAESQKRQSPGKLSEAIAAAEKMRAIDRKALGDFNEDVVCSLERLAGMSEAREEFAAARQSWQDPLAIRLRLYGERDWRMTDARVALEPSIRLSQRDVAQRRKLSAAAARPDSKVNTTGFVRPEKTGDPLIYGIKNGIAVAIHPFGLDDRREGGPRGLIRVGYQADGKYYLINFIAVEPLVGSAQGFSELERGGDDQPGMRFWVGDSLENGSVGQMGNVAGTD